MAVSLLLPGCHQTISLGHDDRASGGSDTTGSAGETTSTSPGDGLEETASGTFGVDGSTTNDHGSSGADADDRATTDADSEGLCAADQSDNACVSCTKTLCCEIAQNCLEDVQCACMLDCMKEARTISTCTQQCRQNALAMQLGSCIGMSCPGACS